MKIILLFCEAKGPYKSVLHSIGLKIKLSTIGASLPWLIELSFPLKGARLLFRIKAVQHSLQKSRKCTLSPAVWLVYDIDSIIEIDIKIGQLSEVVYVTSY